MKTNDKKEMPGPVPFCDLPKVKMDFKAILQYARQRGVHPNDLTMQEREQFVSYCDEDLLSARQTENTFGKACGTLTKAPF